MLRPTCSIEVMLLHPKSELLKKGMGLDLKKKKKRSEALLC